MALTREDVLQLLEILRQDEGLREEFRRLLLPPDLPAWMQKMDRWTERMDEWTQKADKWMADTDEWKGRVDRWMADTDEWKDRVDRWMADTDEWKQRTDERLERMEKWMAETDEWKRETREWQQKTEKRLARMDKRFMRIESTLGELRGTVKETEYWRKAGRFFGRLFRRVWEDDQTLLERLEQAEAQGLLTPEEVDELLRTNLLLFGEVRRGKFAGQRVLLVGEISATVAPSDVERALGRADIARRADFWAIPFVGGLRWSSGALKRRALSQFVLCGQDGFLQPSPAEDWDAIEQLLAQWQPKGRKGGK
jgi:hypothetical protein